MSGDRRITVGLVGAGGIARSHMSAWRSPGVDILVYSKEDANELCAEFSTGRVVATLENLVAQSQVIDVLTPTYAHEEAVRAGLDAGRQVICEKPLALDAPTAQQLLELSRARDNALYVAHVVRYFPEYATLHDAVSSGYIGRPAVARLNRTGTFPQWASWFADEEKSGGIVDDLMIHDLDIARWVLGEVRSVYATLRHATAPDGRRVSVAQATLRHEDEAISNVRATWGPVGTPFRTSFYVAGTDGCLEHDSTAHPPLQVRSDAPTDASMLPTTSGSPADPYYAELSDFMESMSTGSTPRVSAEDAVEALKLADAVRLSAHRDAVVEL